MLEERRLAVIDLTTAATNVHNPACVNRLSVTIITVCLNCSMVFNGAEVSCGVLE